MSIINCTECGKEISDQAKMCPNCGYPLKKKGKGFAVASLVLGILSCFYTYTFCFAFLMERIAASISTTNIQQGINEMKYGVLPLIIVVSSLAIVFGFISHKDGCKLRKKTAGIVMGIVSIVVSVLFAIIF